ncbi:hypothetical protein FB45DRAFT_1004128 [Roridomyces roridus]|uniref:Uncharacterized protein n=1 Tax=Roridomyces roridus TaxID=1738132 RepID=A0AAD7FJZ1_9AGAR|nr:hypothetical protein FB45DRAFT_1004128 [Roridomyces roridus]
MPSLESQIDHAIELAIPSCSANFAQHIQDPRAARVIARKFPSNNFDPNRISLGGGYALSCALGRFFEREDLTPKYCETIGKQLFTPDVFISLMEFQPVPPHLEHVEQSSRIPLLAICMIDPAAQNQESDEWFAGAFGPAVMAAHAAFHLPKAIPSVPSVGERPRIVDASFKESPTCTKVNTLFTSFLEPFVRRGTLEINEHPAFLQVLVYILDGPDFLFVILPNVQHDGVTGGIGDGSLEL